MRETLDICLSNGVLSVKIPEYGLSAVVDQILFDTPLEPKEGRPIRANVVSLHGLSQTTANMLSGEKVRSIGIAPQYQARLPRTASSMVRRWRATKEGYKLAWL